MEIVQKTLSALIAMAHADYLSFRGNPLYKLDFFDTHCPRDGIVHISLAGAVIARRLGAPPDKELDYEDFKGPARNALRAIELVSIGNTPRAAMCLRDALRPSKYKYDVAKAMNVRTSAFDLSCWHADRDERIRSTISILESAGV